MSTASQVEAGRKVGLRAVIDDRGIIHFADNQHREDECCCMVIRPLRLWDGTDGKVCLWCREQPGRYRHAQEVLG